MRVTNLPYAGVKFNANKGKRGIRMNPTASTGSM
jgi:hypothetical protein